MHIEAPDCDWISLPHKFKRGALWMCRTCGLRSVGLKEAHPQCMAKLISIDAKTEHPE